MIERLGTAREADVEVTREAAYELVSRNDVLQRHE